MRGLLGALLRRMAERVDPRPRSVIHILPGNSDLTEKIRAELKRLNRINGVA